MKTISRRRFIAAAACTVAATRLSAQSTADPLTLSITGEATGPHMPNDFVGLSYEIQQLADPILFSLANHGLISHSSRRSTSSHGVLRLGGNDQSNSPTGAPP